MSAKQSAKEGEFVVEVVGNKESNGAKEPQSSASEQSSKVATSVPFGCSSPEISISSRPDPQKVKLNHTLSRRKSLNRSAKSRFGELSEPIDSSTSLEPVEELNEGDNQSVSMDSHPSASTEELEYEMDEYQEIRKRNYQKRRDKDVEAVRRALIWWIFFLCNLGCLVASLTVPKLENLVVWGVVIWKWCALVMVISCGMLITNCFMSFIVSVIKRSLIRSFSFEKEKKVLFYVYGMKKSVEVVMWCGLVRLTWLLLFKRGIKRSKRSTKILGYITRTIVSVLIGAFLWLLKTLLVRILESKLEDIVGETMKKHMDVLGTLFIEAFFVKARKDRDKEKTEQMNPEKDNTVLARIRVWLEAVFRFARIFTESRNAWDGPQDDRVEEAAAAAHLIFRNIAQSGSEYIEEKDLLNLTFMEKKEVDLVFDLIEGADSRRRRIDRNSLTQWVVMIYTGRKALSHALDDTKAVVAQVDTLVTSIMIVISVVVFLLLLEIATTNLLVLISSQLVLAAFAFGSTCKNVFESIMFLFVAHPFDVGDRIVLDGVPMIVEEMNIFNTTFLKANNEKVYYPNSVLSTKPISNYFRSPEMGDTVEFSIALPPVEKIFKLKEKVKEYFERNPQCWKPIHNVAVVDIEDMNKLKMAVSCHYTTNFQDLGRKNLRRAELKLELLKILEELNITCYESQDGSLTQTKSDSTAN